MARAVPLSLQAVVRRLGLSPRFLRFGVVGFMGVGVNLTLLFVLTAWAHFFYLISAGMAVEAAILSNFLLNYRWTWGDRRGSALRCMFKFHSVSLVGLAVNLGVLAALTQGTHLHYLLSDFLGVGLATVWNFYANDLWTFHAMGAPGAQGGPR